MPDRPERLYLVGMMGSGKTTVGRLVATKLGWVHVDSDEQVCKRTGRTVREIFETDGEAAFRREESQALHEAATTTPPSNAVVSVAGGAVLDRTNRQTLTDTGDVVWLDAPADVLATRVHAGADHRPLLGDDPERALTRLEQERRPLYEELADFVVDAADSNPTQLAEQIVAWFQRARTDA